MPLYRASAAQFRLQLLDSSLVPALIEQYRFSLRRSPARGEITSWERSLPALSAALNEAGLDDVEVLVEHQMPLTSSRADVILCGTHPSTGDPSYVVVELKQWSRAHLLSETLDVCVVDGYGGEHMHPAEQVRRYCTHLLDFLASLEPLPDPITGLAYLHNADDNSVAQLFDLEPDELGRVITGQRKADLLSFLTSRLCGKGAVEAADLLIGSAVRPSRQLLAVAAQEVQERATFTLLDQQQTAFSLVLRAVERSYRGDAKEVIVVRGGPGSGKSVIALSLLGELSRQGRTVLHATGSSAFTQTLRKVAGRRAPRVKAMFKYFNQFVDAGKNGLDVLILDEAHRIRETSANRYTPATNRTGRPQVDELIDAARVPVFLLDENQVVRPGEMGSVPEITAAARHKGLQVRLVDLNAQFRCGGSRVYEEWVFALLELDGRKPERWIGDGRFDVDVVDSPLELEARLRQKEAAGLSARISAGYCWKWSKPLPDGGLVDDVRVGPWRRPWNNPKDTQHGTAPGRPFWATDPAGFDQVGCIYTAQGFEYDWSGVIMGPDLVRRGGRWVTRPEHSFDTPVKRAPAADFDRAVRNTYKVLLTRGMQGTLLLSTDTETQDFLQGLIAVGATGAQLEQVSGQR